MYNHENFEVKDDVFYTIFNTVISMFNLYERSLSPLTESRQ
jgi:hypothetical protein